MCSPPRDWWELSSPRKAGDQLPPCKEPVKKSGEEFRWRKTPYPTSWGGGVEAAALDRVFDGCLESAAF